VRAGITAVRRKGYRMTSIIGAAGVFMAGVATGIWLLVLLGELSERPSANNG